MADCLWILQKYENFRVCTKRTKTSTLQASNDLTYDHEEISAYVYIKFRNLASLKSLKNKANYMTSSPRNIPENQRPRLGRDINVNSRKLKYNSRNGKEQNKISKMEGKMANLGRLKWRCIQCQMTYSEPRCLKQVLNVLHLFIINLLYRRIVSFRAIKWKIRRDENWILCPCVLGYVKSV